MEKNNQLIFIRLFKECCEKCFGFSLQSPLSEPDCKLLSNKILEQTGLVIGAKSIKNYSKYIFDKSGSETGKENPTAATLDTFARYALDAPFTSEIQRKDNESHYPYWFEYKNKFRGGISKNKFQFTKEWYAIALVLIIITALIVIFVLSKSIKKQNESFWDDFNSVSIDSLTAKGWKIKSADTIYWNKTNEKPGHLTLYTLKGDNWNLGENKALIKNLLMHEIGSECFATEIHLSGFVPTKNWQQAGIILSEDSTLTGKMIRFTISYNDFFGGYEKPAEIILQAISSTESGLQSKPEEIIHLTLFSFDNEQKNIATENLKKTALKIEKNGNHFRLLYSVSPIESFTYNKAIEGDFTFHPAYVSIFAIQGWSDDNNIMPVYFDSFGIMNIVCNEK